MLTTWSLSPLKPTSLFTSSTDHHLPPEQLAYQFGLGPLRYEAQRGMYLHPTYAGPASALACALALFNVAAWHIARINSV